MKDFTILIKNQNKMDKLEKLILKYGRKIKIVQLNIEKQRSIVKQELKRCREEGVPATADPGYTYEYKEYKELESKSQMLKQMKKDLEDLQ